MYRSLDSEKIINTIETLHRRIGERFPDSGLSKVCWELLTIAKESHKRSAWIAKPQRALRFIIGVLIVVIILSLISIFASLTLPRGGFDVVGFVQVSESGMNILILVGATILFLITLESRIKRSRALKAIHELRALAHVIDMHQLTKAPDRILLKGEKTPSSPKQNLSAFELVRYLDYCSEMLSLTGKIAALYVQKFSDPVALTAVEEVEELTTGLTRKIWQKIMILNFLMTRDEEHGPMTDSMQRVSKERGK